MALRTVSVVGLLAVAGCSANVSSGSASGAQGDEQDGIAGGAQATTAVVTFERVTAGDATRVSTVARFIQGRSAQVDGRALKLVGAAFDLPPSSGCIVLSDDADGTAARGVDLADVGALTVSSSTPASTFTMVPRQVPDPVGLVAGVLYYAPATDAAQVAPGTRYLVRGAGSTDVPAFELSGTAPGDFSDVRINQSGAPQIAQNAAQSSNQTGQARVALALGAGVDLTWSTSTGIENEGGDSFFVDVVTARGTSRCAADAAGAIVPSAAFLADDGLLAVHRVHRDRTRARDQIAASQLHEGAQKSIDSSELRFDFSRVVSFSRR